MKEEQAPKDILSHLLKDKVIQMPFSDFEERMMIRIKLEAAANDGARRDIKLSSLFFTIGCCLGIVATVLASAVKWSDGVQQGSGSFFWQSVMIVLFSVLVYRIPAIKRVLWRTNKL